MLVPTYKSQHESIYSQLWFADDATAVGTAILLLSALPFDVFQLFKDLPDC